MDTSRFVDASFVQGGFGFKLYLLFIFSWFLHLTARLPVLGVIRSDLLLITAVMASALGGGANQKDKTVGTEAGKILLIIALYIVATLPFVQWPGSVINRGLEAFIKAVVFYFFTVSLVTTEDRLKVFMGVFLGCQVFRGLEPLYLHVTMGYWGSGASMGNWEFMNRLSGAPHDIVNPNGLAFVIATVLPFLYYLSLYSKTWAFISVGVAPALLYALMLTGSRSGILALVAIAFGIIIKSKRKIFLALVFAIVGTVMFVNLNPDQQDRYLSIFFSDTKNARTAAGRTEGIKEDFKVALHKPLFGHGIGTSREANFNFGGYDQPSHNLYTETAQELGFLGLIIWLWFLKSVVMNFSLSIQQLQSLVNGKTYLLFVGNAMQVWLLMNFLFSFASYGLTSYEWYLFGGLSVVLRRLSDRQVEQKHLVEVTA